MLVAQLFYHLFEICKSLELTSGHEKNYGTFFGCVRARKVPRSALCKNLRQYYQNFPLFRKCLFLSPGEVFLRSVKAQNHPLDLYYLIGTSRDHHQEPPVLHNPI